MSGLRICLNVRDMRASIAFYKGLGFRPAWVTPRRGTPTFASMRLEGGELWLVAIAANREREFRRWVKGELGKGAVAVFEVKDVDVFWRRAQRIGAKIESPIEDDEWGRGFLVDDPDGYVLTFWSMAKPKRKARKKPKKR